MSEFIWVLMQDIYDEAGKPISTEILRERLAITMKDPLLSKAYCKDYEDEEDAKWTAEILSNSFGFRVYAHAVTRESFYGKI